VSRGPVRASTFWQIVPSGEKVLERRCPCYINTIVVVGVVVIVIIIIIIILIIIIVIIIIDIIIIIIVIFLCHGSCHCQDDNNGVPQTRLYNMK
jgi:hypothetical protein